jgi:outer membrane receptor protein involved in Fe transport
MTSQSSVIGILFGRQSHSRTCLLVLLFLAAAVTNAWSATLRGTVEGPRGPLADVQVTLLQEGREVVSVTTSPTGEFLFDRLNPGVYRLQANLTPFLPAIEDLELGDGDMEIVLRLGPLNESVTVTASRLPAPVATSVANVKVLNEDTLRGMPYQTLDDSLRSLPEFSLFRRSSSLVAHPTTQGFSLRGIGPSGVSRSLLLSDGVPVNDAFGGWVHWNRIPALSLQQVEVANGGGSALYGNYGLGGVMQLLKKLPTPSTAEFQIQGGSRDAVKGDFYASHRVGDYGFSASGSVLNFDGYPIVEESDRGAVDVPAGVDSRSFRFYFERAPLGGSSVWSLEGGFFNEDRSNGTPVQTNDTRIYDFATRFQFSPAPRDRVDIRAFFRRTLFESQFSAVSGDRNLERLTNQQFVPAADGGVSLLWSASRDRHQIVAGGDLWLIAGESKDNIHVGAFGAAPRFLLSRYGLGKQATFGFFAEENFAATPRLTLVVGGRLDVVKNYDAQTGVVSAGAPFSLDPVASNSETVFSPRAGFTYQAMPEVALYGSLFRSFRSPTLNELYRQFTVGNIVTLPNIDLTSERNLGFELGTRVQPMRTMRISLSGFFNHLEDPVSNVTLADQPNPAQILRQRQNLGNARIAGLEATASWQVDRDIQLGMVYLFSRATVTENPADTTLVDKLLPQVPQHRVNLTADMGLPGGIRLNWIGRFVGDQYDDDLNEIVLDEFFQLDANVSRSVGQSAQVFVMFENLTGERIVTNRSPVEFLGTPFQVRGGVSFRLGGD